MTLTDMSPASKHARWTQMRKDWRAAHPDRVKAYHAKHCAKPEVKERKRAWARANRAKINELRRAKYAASREVAQTPPSDVPAQAATIGDLTIVDFVTPLPELAQETL